MASDSILYMSNSWEEQRHLRGIHSRKTHQAIITASSLTAPSWELQYNDILNVKPLLCFTLTGGFVTYPLFKNKHFNWKEDCKLLIHAQITTTGWPYWSPLITYAALSSIKHFFWRKQTTWFTRWIKLRQWLGLEAIINNNFIHIYQYLFCYLKRVLYQFYTVCFQIWKNWYKAFCGSKRNCIKSDKCPLVVSLSLPENGRLQVGGWVARAV